MDPELLEVVREALHAQQRKEPLEKSIGRAVRRRGLDFSEYVEIVSEIRDITRRRNIDFEDSARSLLSQSEEQPDEDEH